MERRLQPRPPITESLVGALLATFGAGLLLGLVARDMSGLLGPHPTNLEIAMDITINGHPAKAAVGVDDDSLFFEFRNHVSGQTDQLRVKGEELISVLGLLGMQELPPNGRMPGEPPPTGELPPDPNARAAINELAGDAIDQMGGAFDPAAGDASDRDRELDADERAAHEERPDADAPQS